jgi:sulfonate transport system permease protein
VSAVSRRLLRRPAVPAGRWLRRPPTFVLSLVGLIVVWSVASALAGSDRSGDSLIPSIVDIGGAFHRFADYWRGGLGVEKTSISGHATFAGAVLGFFYNTGLTALHMVGGVVLGVGAGTGVAVAICWSRTLRDIVAFPGHFARMLPMLAMGPLFALWFGDTNGEAILFVGFTAFALVFPVALNAIANVPDYYAQFAASLGASRARIYVHVILPAALRETRTGVFLAVGFGWSAAIAIEYVGHDYGLGHIAQNAVYFARTNVLGLVALVALLLAGLSFFVAARVLDRMTRWAED